MGTFGAFFSFPLTQPQKVTKMTSQSPSGTLPGTHFSLQGRSKAAKMNFWDAPGRARASPGSVWKQGRGPRALQGAILESFWSHFEAILACIFDPPVLHFGTSAAMSFRHVCCLCLSSFFCAPRPNQAARKQRQRQYANKGHANSQQNPSTYGAQASASDGMQA